MRKYIGIAIAILALAAAASAVAQAGTDKTVHKSYVCKYVGKPGVDERLQTGQNPIWVDNHSLGTVVTYVGEEFADAQGKSVVIVANTAKLTPEPTISDCPAPQGCQSECGPATTTIEPNPPVMTLADCENAETLAIPDQPVGFNAPVVDGPLVGPGRTLVTFTTEDGYVLPDGTTSITYTFDLTGALTRGCGGGGGGGGGHHHHGHKPPSVPKGPTLKQYKQDVQNGAEPGGG
jgi:hypothetical protein